MSATPFDPRSIFTIMESNGRVIEIYVDGRVSGLDGDFVIRNGIAPALHSLLGQIDGAEKRKAAIDALSEILGGVV